MATGERRKKKLAATKTKARAKTPLQKLGRALASTAEFAAGVARETDGVIRDLASQVTNSKLDEVAPRAPDLLVHQHRMLEKLFERVESSKKNLELPLAELADELSAHIAIEERLFYPAVRKLKPDLILEGLEEHAMGRFALERLLGTKASEESLRARFKALKELMTNHHREEERELFTAVRRALPNPALEKLGAAMKELFDAEVKRGHEAVLATFDDHLRKPVHGKAPQRSKSRAGKKAPRRAKTA